jgi:hypothetical protein
MRPSRRGSRGEAPVPPGVANQSTISFSVLRPRRNRMRPYQYQIRTASDTRRRHPRLCFDFKGALAFSWSSTTALGGHGNGLRHQMSKTNRVGKQRAIVVGYRGAGMGPSGTYRAPPRSRTGLPVVQDKFRIAGKFRIIEKLTRLSPALRLGALRLLPGRSVNTALGGSGRSM